jgi:hypothetical protein
MIHNVPEARRRLLIVLSVLLVLDICAVALLLSPIGRSRAARQDEYTAVRKQLEAKRRETLPTLGMDKKLDTAREQIESFYKDRIPDRYSDISQQIGKLAAENHVQIAGIKYVTGNELGKVLKFETPGATRIGIDAQLAGDYVNEMKFINALERSKLLFVVNSVDLGEAQGGNVRLELRFETYLRGA